MNEDMILIRECRHCGFEGKPVLGKEHPMHGFALSCSSCGKWLAWSGKVKPLKVDGQRNISSNWTAARLGIDLCQLCRRPRKFLGGGTLEIHHVHPVAEGGEDVPANIWVVCTACHKDIHHKRTYLHDHLKEFFSSHAAYQKLKAERPDLFQEARP